MGFTAIRNENKINEGRELKDKVLLLSGFSDAQLTMFLDYYKANSNLPKAHFAVITPTTRVKRVKEVIQDVIQEGENQ